jgi:hypothetical protein
VTKRKFIAPTPYSWAMGIPAASLGQEGLLVQPDQLGACEQAD